jgi:hypothetical protein
MALVPSVAALTVSTIYCLWQAYHQRLLQQQRTLRERVAYMLWEAAMRDGPLAGAGAKRG